MRENFAREKKSVLAFLVPLFGLYRETNFLYFSVAIFQVVKFPNVPCEVSGGNKNGTCYTSEECSDRGGVSDGSCADGYGVCCVCKYFGLYFSQLDKISRTFLQKKYGKFKLPRFLGLF